MPLIVGNLICAFLMRDLIGSCMVDCWDGVGTSPASFLESLTLLSMRRYLFSQSLWEGLLPYAALFPRCQITGGSFSK